MKVIDPYINDVRIRNIESKVKDLCEKIDLLEKSLSEEGEVDGQEDKRTRRSKKKSNRERSQAEA